MIQPPYVKKANFSSNEKIYRLTENGKYEESASYLSKKCPYCKRYEHNFELKIRGIKSTIWCCSDKNCMETRLNNAGILSEQYPLNFLRKLRERSLFSQADLVKNGLNDDFIDKWNLLKEGKIKDIIILGDIGCGKTHCMYGALHNVCETNLFSTKFCTEEELYKEIKHSWEDKSKTSEEGIIERLVNVKFLFLDDIGAATKTIEGEWGKQLLLSILDLRLNSATLHTIISTNFSIEQIPLIYDARIADRINFMTPAFIKGGSQRKPISTVE
jgi:DNA replication protein DnaC